MRIRKFKALLIVLGIAGTALVLAALLLNHRYPSLPWSAKVIAGIGPFTIKALDAVGYYPSGTWRYKITVVVETPEGIKTGAAVREVQAKRQFSILTSTGETTKTSVSGEAVVVDLGERGVLFALMDIDGSYNVVHQAFPFPGGAPLTREGIQYYDSLYKKIGDRKVALELASYPMLITFTDRDDPKTVTPVMEIERIEKSGGRLEYKITRDRFEELFGEGVKLREIAIQMTDEAVTGGIMNRLPWLPAYYNQRLDGSRFGTIEAKNRLANDLSAGAFSTKGGKNER